MLITVQSFATIGRRSSEILCLVKKTSRLKQKAFGTNVPGGLTNVIKTMVLVSTLRNISLLPIYVCVMILYLAPYPIEWQATYYGATFIAFSYMCTNPFIHATKFEPVKQVLIRMIPCKKTNQGNAGSVDTGT